MRLLVQSAFRPAGGIIGARADELKWPRAVRPRDELLVEAEVLEVRPSRSRPDHGFVECRTTTLNQHREPVQVLVMNLLVEARRAPGGSEQAPESAMNLAVTSGRVATAASRAAAAWPRPNYASR